MKNLAYTPASKTLLNRAMAWPKMPVLTARVMGGFLILTLFLSSCSPKPAEKAPQKFALDQVTQNYLRHVRLADGVPLNIQVSVRWKIADYEEFSNQFSTPGRYDSLILAPRQLELANKVANTYSDVDSVFTSDKEQFVTEVKNYLLKNLGETGVEIKEVIVARVDFPKTYTTAKEQLATQEQELAAIRKQRVIDLEKAESQREQAEANGKVAMAQAEMDAKVQKINAETEKSRRTMQLAKAETEKQVARLRAQSDAEKKELLSKAELNRQRDLKDLEMQKKKELNTLAIQKQSELDKLTFSQDMQMAKLCSENPVYANYMVNKELASKVQIAVLPSTGDAGVFSNLLNNGMANK
ncbi:hypothetical protein KFE98_10305 [bacterium SCSIO 12741]|nr:hypothetical protein KFE98_10305 [bacterium SCSIO 12741]